MKFTPDIKNVDEILVYISTINNYSGDIFFEMESMFKGTQMQNWVDDDNNFNIPDNYRLSANDKLEIVNVYKKLLSECANLSNIQDLDEINDIFLDFFDIANVGMKIHNMDGHHPFKQSRIFNNNPYLKFNIRVNLSRPDNFFDIIDEFKQVYYRLADTNNVIFDIDDNSIVVFTSLK